MERFERLIGLVPSFTAAGLLDASGGNLALRTQRGIYVTPSQAGELLQWRLSAEDFVLFPGAGEASMARAGRRPSREHRLHRAVLASVPAWNCSYFGQPWGMLGYALAACELELSAAQSQLISRHHAVTISVLPEEPVAPVEQAEHCAVVMKQEFHDAEYGAMIIAGAGIMVAGLEPEGLLALALTLEKCARAQLWRLSRRQP